MAVLSILLAAVSAVVWGTGDFCGGKASQRAQPLVVTVLSQIIGLPVLAICVALVARGGPTAADIGYGALAGIAGFGGIVLLYRGLSRGPMAIFAPTSAVMGALVPLVVGLLAQRLPGVIPLVGAVCAVTAIGLVSVTGGRAESSTVTPGLIGLALACGSMFGIFFAVLGLVGSDAGIWPVVGVRAGSIGAGLAVVLATRTRLTLGRPTLRWTAVAGALDILANVLYVLAVSEGGSLSIIAPIAALYPVSTVLLALAVDRERLRPAQLAGLGLAVTALVLVAT
jgi:uncharacterized membrane protein